jgi:dipeptidase D
VPIRLVSINGGITHNAIAREARALISVPDAREADLRACIDEFYQTARKEYGQTEPNLSIGIEAAEKDPAARLGFSEADTQTLIRLLMAMPHGVRRMSADIPGLVETSNNLATIRLEDNRLQILSSQRSSSMSRLAEITGVIESVAALAGASTTHQNSYPAWPPNMASALIQRCKTVYQRLFGKQPLIQSIHAGLECGLIGAKHPGMDMISFGPTIENPHSPNERLHIPSIAKTWDFLVALLESYTKPSTV